MDIVCLQSYVNVRKQIWFTDFNVFTLLEAKNFSVQRAQVLC